MRPLIYWYRHSARKTTQHNFHVEPAWHFIEWKYCLHVSNPFLYSPGIYIWLGYMLILRHRVQCNIQFLHCTLNSDCIKLSIRIKRRYMESSFLVHADYIHHTLDQCVDLCISDYFCGSKLNVPGDSNKNLILFTNMMSDVRLTFL